MNAPTQPRTLADVSQQQSASLTIAPGFDSLQSFELIQRVAKTFASSDLVPEQYRSSIEKRNRYGEITDTRENPKAVANCIVAVNMAYRMRADPLMVMQNLSIIEGRPSWSSQFIIAMINNCGRFTPLRFEIVDLGEKDVEYISFEWTGPKNDRTRTEVKTVVKVRDQRCVAWVVEKATGERLESSPVSIELAVKEGWYTKNGSKWKTMPEQMLRYRSGAFFGRIYAPELLMGLPTEDEVRDTIEFEQGPDGKLAVDIEKLRTTQVQDSAAAAEKERHNDATDVNATEHGAPTSPVVSESEAGETQPNTPAQRSEPLPETEIAARLNAANSSDELNVAIALIADVPDPDAEKRLTDLATSLRSKFERAGRRARGAAPSVE